MVNNFLLYFRKRADVSFNKQVFDNYYFITFMKKDTLFLIKILKQNKKVIVRFIQMMIFSLIRLSKSI